MDKALRSYSLSKEMNQMKLQKEASMVISEVHEKTGIYREALPWHKVFLAHSDSLGHFDQQKKINRIEARYNYEKTEKEISSITGRSARSIQVTCSRIRTKLRLSRNDNLSSFLAVI